MNEMFRISDFPVDIDPVWAGDGSHLPEWFVSALKVPREEGYVEIVEYNTKYIEDQKVALLLLDQEPKLEKKFFESRIFDRNVLGVIFSFTT